ncbi:hypothetical protein O3M35_003965 [Rhynocoris fuscipes]|uniref:Uncharacterized protein n=1 Tax=Rhynocoris fuscipes TaxID=488301 RepID=A0AAW1CK71_9HEMI
MAYRSSRHETTHLTSYYAMFGREISLPIDAEEIEKAYRFVRQVQAKEQEAQKMYYDRDAKEVTYKESDEVWLWMPVVRRGRSAKLHRPWTGPLKIVKKLSDVTFRVQDCK